MPPRRGAGRGTARVAAAGRGGGSTRGGRGGRAARGGAAAAAKVAEPRAAAKVAEPPVAPPAVAPTAAASSAGSATGARRPPQEQYEDVWEKVYLAGTDWDQLEAVNEIDWDFEHLDEALSTGGVLSTDTVYLFGSTEPQLLDVNFDDEAVDESDGAAVRAAAQRKRMAALQADADAYVQERAAKRSRANSGKSVEQPKSKAEEEPPTQATGGDGAQTAGGGAGVLLEQTATVIPIPVIVAVVSKRPPPETVAITSVQRSSEELVPMAKLKMGWHPLLRKGARRMPKQPRVFVLKCEQRRARLRNMTEDDVKTYEYVLPYVFLPEGDAAAAADEVDTEVTVTWEKPDGKTTMFPYDWEMDDDVDEFVEAKMKDEELEGDAIATSMAAAITAEVKATKARYREEKLARKQRIEAMPAEELESLRTMKLIKFYPQNTKPDVSKMKTAFCNRYYGKAKQVF